MNIKHTFSSSDIIKAATIFQELNSIESNALASMSHYSYLAGGYMLLLDIVEKDEDNPKSIETTDGGINLISRNTLVYIQLLKEVSNISEDDLTLLLQVMISSRLNKDLSKQFTDEIQRLDEMVSNSN